MKIHYPFHLSSPSSSFRLLIFLFSLFSFPFPFLFFFLSFFQQRKGNVVIDQINVRLCRYSLSWTQDLCSFFRKESAAIEDAPLCISAVRSRVIKAPSSKLLAPYTSVADMDGLSAWFITRSSMRDTFHRFRSLYNVINSRKDGGDDISDSESRKKRKRQNRTRANPIISIKRFSLSIANNNTSVVAHNMSNQFE